jgi:RNA-directed DNA polymerase
MNGAKKSDDAIVATKPANKRVQARAELVEPRASAKRNAAQSYTVRAQPRAAVLQRLDRVRSVARERRKERFTTLMPYLDVAMLKFAYGELKRNAAPGVDGMTWQDYGEGLDERLADLENRLHRGSYRAQPSRRHFIPKADGRLRPLGIAALEDKIVQRAVVEILNAIYEEDFLDLSYGFRPGRGQHDALNALAAGINGGRVNRILDADIRAFFDSIDHDWMMRLLEHRIGDRRILRLIRKWLTVGVIGEDGVRQPATVGSPQGAVISPLLANVYLHYVYDLWAAQWSRMKARGAMFVVRYADDTVACFEYQDDAERFVAELRLRMGNFGLELHADKTRLIEFGKRAAANRKERGEGKPDTFDFLGFTHICGRSRRGYFLLHRHTKRKSMVAKLQEVAEGLRERWHTSIAEQGRWLGQIVRGHIQYFGVPTNIRLLQAFRHHVSVLWYRALKRRSQKDKTTWDKMVPRVRDFLPVPRICHPWPTRA